MPTRRMSKLSLNPDDVLAGNVEASAEEAQQEKMRWGATNVLGDWLFMGGAGDAENQREIEKHGITHIVNTAMEDGNYKGTIKLHRLRIKDCTTSKIADHFSSVIDFIETAHAEGGKVLVHCKKGVSRSPTLILAYLLTTFSISLDTAYNYLVGLRPKVAPNLGFLLALQSLERELSRPPDKRIQINL
eukprot:TRINITY_DN14575_c0_g1_i1.p1 TRINITY_DN14575_c0_g1~~TRINITY_DN14575_c0_g1_i1.p1  ORF type:complete len:188 (+),score=15.47 TRINITY_DN14575_c0_g1_i1:50-613(+)